MILRIKTLRESLNIFQHFRASFCTSITKDILMKNLYSVNPIIKNIPRSLLSMTYSPGVSAVSEAIQHNPLLADKMTLRSRSIAIVTNGNVLDTNGQNILPVMDWYISQIKYYSNLDAFPFVISKNSHLDQILQDLATCYGTVLYLDQEQVDQIPENLLFVRQIDIVKELKCEITDAEKTASILAYLIDHKIKGFINQDQIIKGANYQTKNSHCIEPYGVQIKDGRDVYSHALQLHEFYQGKIQIQVNFHDISRIKPHFTESKLRKLVQENDVYCKSSQLSAIVTDGTAVLGMGNIGPMGGLPVMEGKSLLFKMLGDVQVVPVCVRPRKTIEQQIKAIINLLGNFEAINLEDIKAPECFDIEKGLQDLNVMPIFHDDQHGTAIVTLAGLINAAKCVQKKLADCKVIINGAGAAGIAIAQLLIHYGVKDIILCDSVGSIYRGRTKNMNEMKRKMAQLTNIQNKIGGLGDVIGETDIFIGVSSQKALKGHFISKMNKKSIIFALALPYPQIMPNDAKASGAYVYASGRSDFENQINDSLVFPGIFRAIMQHKIRYITPQMKVRAAEAIAKSLTSIPHPGYIIPDSLDKDVAIRISNQLGKVRAKINSDK